MTYSTSARRGAPCYIALRIHEIPEMTEGPEKTRVSRRLAAILAADIAGYSALMGADEADTVRNLKEHHDLAPHDQGARRSRH